MADIIANEPIEEIIEVVEPIVDKSIEDPIMPVKDGSSHPVKDGSSHPVKDGSSRPVKDGSSHPVKDGSSHPGESVSLTAESAPSMPTIVTVSDTLTKISAMPKREKPRTTPIRSSSSTPNMKKITLVKMPEIKPFNSPVKDGPIAPVKTWIKQPEVVKEIVPQIQVVKKIEDLKEVQQPIKEVVKEVQQPIKEIVKEVKEVVKEVKEVVKEVKPVITPEVKPVKNLSKSSVKDGPPAPVKGGAIKESIKADRIEADKSTLTNIRSKIPKYNDMSIEEQDRHRRNFSSRYNILRETWKTHDIPQIKDSMSLEEIHEEYEVYVKNIHVSQSTDKYKVYMVIMWLFIEYGCIQIGLNVSGYTMSQVKSMSKYERLLIELGEKNYKYAPMGDTNSDWPVELNILFMALANAAIFIIIKMLCEHIKMGEGIANTIIETMSSYLSGSPPQPGNVLFGGTHHDVSDVPSQNNAMSGLDLPSLISGLGNMFLAGQKPAENTQGKTPKFKPVYEE